VVTRPAASLAQDRESNSPARTGGLTTILRQHTWRRVDILSVLQIPESRLDIFEDVEPSPSDDEYAESLGQDTSPVNHDGHASQATSWYDDTAISRCASTASHRASVFLLGHLDLRGSRNPTEPTLPKTPWLNHVLGYGSTMWLTTVKQYGKPWLTMVNHG